LHEHRGLLLRTLTDAASADQGVSVEAADEWPSSRLQSTSTIGCLDVIPSIGDRKAFCGVLKKKTRFSAFRK
jgi:hypothetical protein